VAEKTPKNGRFIWRKTLAHPLVEQRQIIAAAVPAGWRSFEHGRVFGGFIEIFQKNYRFNSVGYLEFGQKKHRGELSWLKRG
jgi:hypothetical protein